MNTSRQAVIMAGGKGTRLEPFNKTIPKPLIKICGTPIIEHNMKSLLPYVEGYVLIVGYMHEKIRAYFGESYHGKPITYVMQDKPQGTGHAILLARDFITTENTILIYGDDIYDPEMFASLPDGGPAIVGKVQEKWQSYGVLVTKNGNELDKIVEKPSSFVSNLVNVGVYQVTQPFWGYLDKMTLSVRGEYELTEPVTLYNADYPIKVIESHGYWLSVGYPWHILTSQKELFALQPSSKIEGTIEPQTTIKGNVCIGKNSVVKNGVYIDGNVHIGENCVIGPNCYIRGNVTIGNDCKIGHAVEIEEAVIGDKVNIEHLSFVGFSVLGNNIILGAGTTTADRRHDRGNIKVNIKEELIDTGLVHLGAFIGDMVRTGIHTSIFPGRKLHNHSYTLPGEIVKQDKLSSEHILLK